MGLSAVHVNRTLQTLRADGLITTRSGMIIIQDWQRLKELAEFDPTYLHLRVGTEASGHQRPSSAPRTGSA
jgi:hypothetical protein